MNQQTPSGFFYLCLPEITLQTLKEMEKKTGKPLQVIISEAILHYEQYLNTKEDRPK